VQRIRDMLGKARRRMAMQSLLSRSVVTTAVAAGVMLAVLAGERLVSLGVPWWSYIAIFIAGVAAAVVWTLAQRRDDEEVASTLDEKLALDDRLRSALFCAARDDQAFSRVVVDDAERVAGEIDYREALPLRRPRGWWAPPAGLAVFGLSFAFLPAMDLLDIETAREQRRVAAAEVETDRRELVEAIEALDEVPREQLSEEDATIVDELRELSAQDGEKLEDEAARREAAARLSKLRDRLKDEAEQRDSRIDRMRQTMRAAAEDEDGPADELADAMRDGDFERTADELDGLGEKIDELSEADRQKLREQLQQLSEGFQNSAQDLEEQQEQVKQSIRETLKQAGFSEEEIDKLEQQDFDPDAVREMAEQKLADAAEQNPAIKERMEQLRQQQQQRQQVEQQHQDAQQMADAIDEMAEQTRPKPQPQQEKPGGDQQQPSQQQKPGGDQQQPSQQQKPGGDQQQPSQQEKPGGDQQQPSQQEKPGGDQQQPSQQQKSGGDQQQPSQQQKPGGDQQQPSQQEKPGGDQQQPSQQQKPGGDQQQPSQQQKPGGDQQQPSQQQPLSEDDLRQAQQFRDAAERAKRQMQQMQEQQSTGERMQDAAREADDAMQRMARDNRPGQKPGATEQPKPDAQQLAERRGTPQKQTRGGNSAGDQPGGDPHGDAPQPQAYETTPLRDGQNEPGRAISSWLEEGDAKTTEATSSRSFSDVVETARESAGRSVEQDAIPGKYHETIREYYEQLPTEPAGE